MFCSLIGGVVRPSSDRLQPHESSRPKTVAACSRLRCIAYNKRLKN